MALLDDVASLAKVAAASLDDIAGHAAKATTKSAGVVIDDAAVTPRYVVGFSADRELPIVAKIAVGSLKNKLLFLLPIAMALSAFAPGLITPLLMLGGLFLCYEGAEKVYEALLPQAAHDHEEKIGRSPEDPVAFERRKVAGAIRTDFILSAEIMAIALSTVPDADLFTQFVTLVVVALGITGGVYGAVALIVRADDFGVALAQRESAAAQTVGRGIVRVMPAFLAALAVIGTAAMIWVGGGIVVHGLEVFGLTGPAHLLHDASEAVAHAIPLWSGFFGWFAGAALSGIVGLLLGALLIPVVSRVVVPLAEWAKAALGR